ncbi:hypothetical protein P23_2456 [Acinetobacter calcoaceticus]|nr:hypothetical protein P23_2456 [Acinetobacter calcoaceticus]
MTDGISTIIKQFYKSATITPIFILIDFRSLALQSPQ